MALFIEERPIRTALRWQLYATAASMALAAIWMGTNAACSALLGGLINVNAGAVFGLLASRRRGRSPGLALMETARAEAVKIALIVVQLWLALTLYKDVVPVAFFGTFILTVVFFTMAIFIRAR